MPEEIYKKRLEITADGSHTIFVPALDEHYHSVNGAIQESRHVFIEAGLNQLAKNHIRILEIGFGTGLNAFLTLLETEKNKSKTIEYTTVERYPLNSKMVASLNYGTRTDSNNEELFTLLHSSPWEKQIEITSRFSLHKIEGDSNTFLLPEKIDLVYFDAFAPDKQPEMWNQDIFNRLYFSMVSGGIITTYCAKGSVRRMMQEAGFTMERIPGPPGKREMLRGKK